MNLMCWYCWFGNVWELENLVCWLVVFYLQDVIGESFFEYEFSQLNVLVVDEDDNEIVNLGGLVEKYLIGYFDMFGEVLLLLGFYYWIFREVEYLLISVVFVVMCGNQIKVVELFGVNWNMF